MTIRAVGADFPEFIQNSAEQSRMSARKRIAPAPAQESAEEIEAPLPGKQRTAPPVLQQELLIGLHAKVSVNSLMESLKGYDNSDAVAAARERIDKEMYSLVGFDITTLIKVESDKPIVLLEFDQVENQMRKMDEWLAGTGAFDRKMLLTPSSNGFRPLMAKDEKTQKLLDEMAKFRPETEEEIALAKEMAKQIAGLVPEDFHWFEANGLQALTLEEKEEFRSGMDALFQDAGWKVDMRRIGFSFKPSGDLQSINTKQVSEEEKKAFIEMYNKKGDSPESDNRLINRLKELGARNVEMYFDVTV